MTSTKKLRAELEELRRENEELKALHLQDLARIKETNRWLEIAGNEKLKRSAALDEERVKHTQLNEKYARLLEENVSLLERMRTIQKGDEVEKIEVIVHENCDDSSSTVGVKCVSSVGVRGDFKKFEKAELTVPEVVEAVNELFENVIMRCEYGGS